MQFHIIVAAILGSFCVSAFVPYPNHHVAFNGCHVGGNVYPPLRNWRHSFYGQIPGHGLPLQRFPGWNGNNFGFGRNPLHHHHLIQNNGLTFPNPNGPIHPALQVNQQHEGQRHSLPVAAPLIHPQRHTNGHSRDQLRPLPLAPLINEQHHQPQNDHDPRFHQPPTFIVQQENNGAFTPNHQNDGALHTGTGDIITLGGEPLPPAIGRETNKRQATPDGDVTAHELIISRGDKLSSASRLVTRRIY